MRQPLCILPLAAAFAAPAAARVSVHPVGALILSGVLAVAGAAASEWKPVSPTETLLYDIGFEQDAPDTRPSSPKLATSGAGTARIVGDHGGRVLQLAGEHVEISLPVVKLTPCQLGNQNPTLITFNLRVDAADEIRIVNRGGAQRWVRRLLLSQGASRIVGPGSDAAVRDPTPAGDSPPACRSGRWSRVGFFAAAWGRSEVRGPRAEVRGPPWRGRWPPRAARMARPQGRGPGIALPRSRRDRWN